MNLIEYVALINRDNVMNNARMVKASQLGVQMPFSLTPVSYSCLIVLLPFFEGFDDFSPRKSLETLPRNLLNTKELKKKSELLPRLS